MTDKEPESPNPAPIIGKPERGSSKMELYAYHKNKPGCLLRPVP